MPLELRPVTPADLEVLFGFHREPEANHMAAFTVPDPNDRAAFDARWQRLLAEPTVMTFAVDVDGTVVGSAGSWLEGDHREITFWIGSAHWGRGHATRAVRVLLGMIPDRPLRARAAADNVASLRVLTKCGFEVITHERGYANARGEDIDEVLLELA